MKKQCTNSAIFLEAVYLIYSYCIKSQEAWKNDICIFVHNTIETCENQIYCIIYLRCSPNIIFVFLQDKYTVAALGSKQDNTTFSIYFYSKKFFSPKHFKRYKSSIYINVWLGGVQKQSNWGGKLFLLQLRWHGSEPRLGQFSEPTLGQCLTYVMYIRL